MRGDFLSKAIPNPFVLADLGQVDPRELSIAVPIRWIDYPERLYASMDDEFIRSPYQVDGAILRERWDGVVDEGARMTWTETSQLRAKRFDYQEALSKESLAKSYAGDAEFVARRLDREIVELSHLIEWLGQQIASGFEHSKSKGASLGPLGYTRMPLTVESIQKLTAARLDASRRLSELLGLATKVVQVNVSLKEETLAERMQRLMASNDPEYAALREIVNGGLLARGALSASQGESKEAQLRDSEREFVRTSGRVLDGVLLHCPPAMPKAGESDF